MTDSTTATRPTRRVYKPELLARAGMGETWLRALVKRGAVPPGRTDPGCKRQWWLDYEADAIVEGRPVPAREATP